MIDSPARPQALEKYGFTGQTIGVLLCSVALLTIWPLPGTIALRQALLGIGFICSLFALKAHIKTLLTLKAWPLWVFLGFYGWLVIHLLALSHNLSEQLYELHHVWLRCFAATFIGLTLGLVLADKKAFFEPKLTQHQTPVELKPKGLLGRNFTILLILLCFLGTALIALGRYTKEVWFTHQLVHYDIVFAFYKAKAPFVVGAALALPLCFALITRAINRQISRWWIVIGLLGIGVTLFASYFANTKNGVAIFMVCLGVFVLYLMFRIKWNVRKVIFATLVCIAVGMFSYVGLEKHFARNPSWNAMPADIMVALDIDHQHYWKNRNLYPQPTNEYGKPVDISTYERTAWFRAGARLLHENPLGYGLLHHSFGSLASIKWPDFYKPIGNLRGATHSAWMDFALGLGIPGLLLVLVPLFVAWYRSLFQEGLWFSYASWAIPIITFAYLTTEANEMHYTETLFFMIALFCGLTVQSPVRFAHNKS